MKQLIIGSKILKFDELDSTNHYLSELSKGREIKDGTVMWNGVMYSRNQWRVVVKTQKYINILKDTNK